MANSCVVAEALSTDLLALIIREPGERHPRLVFAKDILARTPDVVIVGKF